MSWLSNLFASNKNPGTEANKYLDQIPDQVQPYYQPYQDAGKSSLEDLQKRYREMLDNPGETYNRIGAGYKQSPGYEATLRQAMSGANNAASLGAGGGLGSPGAINNTAQAAGDVANQDFEKYMQNVLGLNSQGLQGEQGLEQQGYGANTDYASMIAQLFNAKGTNAANATAGENQQRGQNWTNLFQLGGAVAPWAANKFWPTNPGQGS